jgi:hypothetical protein
LFFVLGETLNFGLEKQLDRIVETLALSALMANNPNKKVEKRLLQASSSKKVEKRLKEIAFPLEIDLQGDFEDACEKCGHTRCSDGTLTALTKNEHGVWCRRCVEYVNDL